MQKNPISRGLSAGAIFTMAFTAVTIFSSTAISASESRNTSRLWAKIQSSNLAWSTRIIPSSKNVANSPRKFKSGRVIKARSTGSGRWVCSASGFGQKPTCYSR